MAKKFKDKVEEAGHKVAEAATKFGHKVSEKAEEAVDWAKEKTHQAGNRIEETTQKAGHQTGKPLDESTGAVGTIAGIREHMDVYASCGTKIGKVDHVQGDTIKLTKNDSPDGKHHTFPLSWVAKVDDHVHLDRDHKQVRAQWQPA